MEIRDQIDFFFIDPQMEPRPPGQFSVLYLLRRDIEKCVNAGALWPATMATLAGMDLLAKFHAGRDDFKNGKNRFKEFVGLYFQPPDPDDSETLYQLRNALVHSFGLYSRGRQGREYRFMVVPVETEPWLAHDSGSTGDYVVSLPSLFRWFNDTCKQYHSELQTSTELQQKFSQMFERYGRVAVIERKVSPAD